VLPHRGGHDLATQVALQLLSGAEPLVAGAEILEGPQGREFLL
jgi:hypothetical protein